MPGLHSRLSAALLVLGALFSGAGAARGGDDASTKTPAPATVPADAAAVALLAPAEKARRLEAAQARLSKSLASVTSVRACFVQTKRLEVFGRDVVSRGTLALKVPGAFRWDVASPVRAELVVSGSTGVRRRWTRKGDVTETAFELAKDPVTAATIQQVFLWTTGDFAKAAASYRISLLSEAPLVFRAAPTDERLLKVIASVDAEFTEVPARLVKITLTEQTGSHSTLAFHSVEHNPDLPAALFSVDVRPAKPQ